MGITTDPSNELAVKVEVLKDLRKVGVQEEALRLRALDMPSFAATKARINERALHAVRAAASDEMRSAGPGAGAGAAA